MLNALHDMKGSPGLQAIQIYEAEVVDNNDPKKLCRIRARIPELFEGISDDELPWAIPTFSHVDGATDTSGIQFVPKNKSKVFITFQGGNPLFPIWHNYHVDEKTKLQEMEYNYPDRAVIRFQNKALLVIDTKDNELMLRNPGTLKIYIEGNVELEIKGNLEEKVHGNVTRKIVGNLNETISGNVVRTVAGSTDETHTGNTIEKFTGNLDVTIGGTRTVGISGADSCKAASYSATYSGTYQLQTSSFSASLGDGTVSAGQLTLAGSQTSIVGAGGLTFKGSAINFERGGSVPSVSVSAPTPANPSTPTEPVLTDWKGVRGGAAG